MIETRLDCLLPGCLELNKVAPLRRRQKKVVLLGGAHHKVAYPPLVVVKVPIFCGKFFICLESPDTEK